jgi:Caspase domain
LEPAAVNGSRIISIILGADHFDGLRSVKSEEVRAAFAASTRDFAAYVSRIAAVVCDKFNAPDNPDGLCKDLAAFLRSESTATDLIVYYVGHGGSISENDRSEYFLALRGTTDAEKYLDGLRVSNFAQVINKNAARLRAIVILDCCYSARAVKYFEGSQPNATGIAPIPFGLTLFTASAREVEAVVPPNQKYTMFSGCLLDVLNKGIPTAGPRLSIREIAIQVRALINQLYKDDWVRPEVNSPQQRFGDVADYPLFPNPAYPGAPDQPQTEREVTASQAEPLAANMPLCMFVADAGLSSSTVSLACAAIEDPVAVRNAIGGSRQRIIKNTVLDLDRNTQNRLRTSGFDYFVDDSDVRAKFVETMIPLTYEAYTCVAKRSYFGEASEERVFCELFGRLMIDRIKKHRAREIKIILPPERKGLIDLLRGVIASCVHRINTERRGHVLAMPMVQINEDLDECLELSRYVAAIVQQRLDPSDSESQSKRRFRQIKSKVRLIRRLDTGEYFSRHHPLPD